MSLAEQVRHQFSSGVRDRGTRYFRQRLVTNVEQEDGITFADVENSYGSVYEVTVDRNVDGEIHEMDCTCPYFDGNGPCKHLWATILKMDTMAGTITTSAPTTTITPTWSQRLDAVLQLEKLGHKPVTAGRVHRKRELWYVIDVERSQQKESLVIDLQFREEGKSGAMGVVKDCKLNEEQVSEFADTEHRQLLRDLLDCVKANQPEETYAGNRGYYSYYQPPSYSRVTIPAAAGIRLLPMMAATGQLRWSLSASTFGKQPDAIDRRVAWADHDAWKFTVTFQEKRKDKCWLIQGMLAAETEGRPLERSVRDAVLLSASGFALFEDSLGQLDASSCDSPWFKLLRQVGELKVPFKERETFVKKLLSSKSLSAIAFPTRLIGKSTPVECRPRLRFLKPDALPDHLQRSPCLFGAVDFVYGDVEVRRLDDQAGVWDEKSSRVVWRNVEQESQFEKQLLDCGIDFVRVDGWNRVDVDVQVIRRAMPETVRQLITLGWEVRAAGIQIRTPGDFKIGVTSGQDWFNLDAEFDFDGHSVALPELLRAVRNGDHFVKLGDGSQGLLPEEWIQRYAKIAGLGEVVDDAIRFRPSQAMILDALLDAQQGATRDRDFASFCRKLKNFAGIKPKAAPRTFRGDLRDYQKDGLGWLNFLREFRLGGCLADDMGLGKTVQVLAMLESRRTRKLKAEEVRKPSLIVVPKSLIFNWMAEGERFAPNLNIVNYTGTARKEVFANIASADAMITTYGTLRKDITKLAELDFDYAVLDESQAIKNSDSLSSKACRLIQADHRLAMTGTPVENHLGELWSLFEFLNPGMLGSSNAFKALTRARNTDDEDDSRQHLQTVAQALRPFMLRRTKEQVLTELPGKTEQTLYCDMPPKQKKLYNELRDYYRIQLDSKIKTDGLKKSKIHVLEALLRLRQAACHPGLIDKKRAKESSGKVDTAVEQLVQLASEGHKALVFSQFTSLLSIVKTRLDKEKIPYEYLDGKTNKRQERVEEFQSNKDCPLFLISLKAGGHGLNLTAADYVFILDPWWNPAVEAQAVDRAHRMGQEQHVFAYRLICRGTVEERILKMQKEKRQLADAIVSADGSLIKSLTAEDLQLLLS